MATEHSPHENRVWDWAHEETALVTAAEKMGKVVRPPVGGGWHENEIRCPPSGFDLTVAAL